MTVISTLSKTNRLPSKLSALLAGTLLLAGCNVGPKYTRPQVPTPPAFLGADGAAVTSDAAASLGDRKWSEVFHEPELQTLITRALANNYDLRIAAERVLQAQAQVRVTRSAEFPQISIGGTGAGARIPSSTGISGFDGAFATGGLQASASWTPDFWGLYRSQTAAARATMLAQDWAQKAVRITVVQQVANYYFQLRALDEQLAVSKQALQTRQQSVDLTTKLETGGAAPLSDVRQAEQLLYTASAQIPQIEEQIQQNENALRLLLGETPGSNSTPIVHSDPTALQPPDALPTGIPTQLVARRPDILEAEQQLISANANVRVARAQFFPQLAVSSSGGTGGGTWASLVDPSSILVYGLGTLTQPIFTGGKLKGQLELSQHQKEQMLIAYQQSISTAFRDVSNALIAANKTRTQREEQTKLVAAAQDATRLARIRYQGGATSFLEVLTTDANLYSAQLNLATVQGAEAQTLSNLYAALGGGWQP